jgi:predicted regulator of Ras-like GTPase activity (Roadblock/LC7/MglB family)
MTPSTGSPHDPAENRAQALDRILGDLLVQASAMQAAAVVSFDGLPMASALPAGMDEDRVAAMSAALLSLGERAADGLGRGELSQVYVEGDNGTVFLVSAQDQAVLVAVSAREAKTGLMLFEARQAAHAVGAVLAAQAPTVEAENPGSATPEASAVVHVPLGAGDHEPRPAAGPGPQPNVAAQPNIAPAPDPSTAVWAAGPGGWA